MDFTYNASALGVGGVIERGDIVTTIPSLASVALAPTGGEGRSVVSNYFSEELEFSHAETRVYGREVKNKGERQFTTLTYVLLRDLRIFNSLRIAEMRSVVTSTRGLEGGDDHPFELEISYKGVRIGRKDVDPKVDERLKGMKHYQQLEGAVTGGRTATQADLALARRFNATPDQFVKMVREKQPVQGTLVEGIEVQGKPVPPTVVIPGIGLVRFGELMIKPGRRRLNLLRIKFGRIRDGMMFEPQQEGMMPPVPMDDEEEQPFLFSPTGGSMTLCSGEGNGTPIGP